ncbi:MAG: hypothetical protein MUC68_10820 [Burkholderiaceae bacterium]|jgi:hypothetical protein|nr:hypothetical protein [Burkholderiaceae bacterium]
MYPTYGTPNYAAIERRAHEMRREALGELSGQATGWIKRQVVALQDITASVLGRMQRNRDEVFFEAQ